MLADRGWTVAVADTGSSRLASGTSPPPRDAWVGKANLTPPGAPSRGLPPGFHVMLKPSGATCNLDCGYCYYRDKEALYGDGARFVMSDEVLESFTRQYIAAQRGPEVTFAWQGGEPTLRGLEFFRKAVALQLKHARPGMTISNALQTNGVPLDDEWCRFLKEHGVLVGLSLDGPCELHDAWRVDKRGKPTFDRVLRALHLLQRHGVEFNVLCVVSRANGDRPSEVYRFLKAEGVEFIQLIPAVEGTPGDGTTPWTVGAEQWGEFLCGVFDEWVRRDVGRVYVQYFDVALEAWAGITPSLCVHAPTCGNCLALEHNGDLFACDHYVTPEHFLGNVRETPLIDLVAAPFQRAFGRDKRDRLPRQCRECPVRFVCNGGCPKDRFIRTLDGEPGLNYLCAGYKRFFTHIAPAMRAMAELVRHGGAPAAIMEILRREEEGSSGRP